MPNTTYPSLPSILAVLAFAVLSCVGGWVIVHGGGFFHSPGKYSSDAVFYTGAPAVLMAALQFTAAALGLTWLLRLRLTPWAAASMAFGLVCVPPMVFLFLQ